MGRAPRRHRGPHGVAGGNGRGLPSLTPCAGALHLIYLENCANKTSARVRSDADSLPPAMVKSHSRVVVHTGSRSHARGADSVGWGGGTPMTCPSLWPHRTREKQRRRAASAKQAAIPPAGANGFCTWW